MRGQIKSLSDLVAAKDDEIQRLKSTAANNSESIDISTETPPWPWQSNWSASTRDLPTHRELPPLAFANRYAVLSSLAQDDDARPTSHPVSLEPDPAAATVASTSAASPSIAHPVAVSTTGPPHPSTRSKIAATQSSVSSKASPATGAPLSVALPPIVPPVAVSTTGPARPSTRSKIAAAQSSAATPSAATAFVPPPSSTPPPDFATQASTATPHVVPGLPTYSDVVNRKKTTLILADSMLNGIRAEDIDENIGGSETAVLKKFSGATAKEIGAYARFNIQRYRPSQVIVHAGTNDMTQSCRFGVLNRVDPNPEEIAENIIEVGRIARREGVKTIIISTIIYRRWSKYRTLRTAVNDLVEIKCIKEGFQYLNNDNLAFRNLCEDGLHLNAEGNKYLKQNILRCFESFNPYLCNFDFGYHYIGFGSQGYNKF